ncbi:MAG: hypothetical protein R6U50_11670 [Desulfobacterales bacterium]
MKTLQKNTMGFTLLEILIAILIITTGLVGTAGLLVSIIKTNDLSSEMTKATALAQSTMEQIRQAGYIGALEVGESTTDSPMEGFNRTVAVSSTGTSGAKAVNVTVTFRSFGQHTVQLDTILAR